MKVDFALSLLLIHIRFDDVTRLRGWNKFRGLRVDCESTPECRVHGSCLGWLEKSFGRQWTWQLPWLAREEPWSAVDMAAALAG